MWMTSCTGSARGGFWEIWEKSAELGSRHRTRWVDFRSSQWPDEFARYRRRPRWGADGKAIIERLCISLPYVETFNSKVIKGFVPELRSRYVLFVFQDSYALCIYVMNILCTFHVAITWLCNNDLRKIIDRHNKFETTKDLLTNSKQSIPKLSKKFY